MKNGWFLVCLLSLAVLASSHCYAQKVIADKSLNYEVTIPDSLLPEHFNNESDSSPIYYDASVGVVLMISGRKSAFSGVNDYLDCSKKDLEEELRRMQGDSTLRLVECRRSAYFPDKAVVLHFETSAYSPDLNRCFAYFFHYNGKEIQFFFLYGKANYKESLEYIDRIMQTFRLVNK